MEVSTLRYSGGIGLHGRSPLLRLQSDERLILLVRRGNSAAFEVLVSRYHSRLLAFCRHLLGSKEDAEDVLQEVFAAAFNAVLADERAINVRPWLYRIARNRSLNHLRRIQAIGVDSMDIHFSEYGATTADKVHDREQFRLLVRDIQSLPETQRTALVLREMDALSYEQIAEAMDTTVPGVKSLLVRARISLAEAAEARQLSCDEVRIELAEVAEGFRKRPPSLVRRHLRGCTRCATFQTQLKQTNKVLAAFLPVGPVALLRKLLIVHLGHSAGTSSGATAGAAGAGSAATSAGAGGLAAGPVAGGGAAFGSAGGVVSAGAGALASKAAAGLAAAALVTAGAVEVTHVAPQRPRSNAASGASANAGLARASTLLHTGGRIRASRHAASGSGAPATNAGGPVPLATGTAQPASSANTDLSSTQPDHTPAGAADRNVQTDPTVLTTPSGNGGQSPDTKGTTGSGTCASGTGAGAPGTTPSSPGATGPVKGTGGSCPAGGSQPPTAATPGSCDSPPTTPPPSAPPEANNTPQGATPTGGAAPCGAPSSPPSPQ